VERERHVLPLAGPVDELAVDQQRAFARRQFQSFLRGSCLVHGLIGLLSTFHPEDV
jgi:hypothetical protein